MKRNLMVAVLMLLAASAKSGLFPTWNFQSDKVGKDPQTVSQTGYLVNETGLTYQNTYYLDAAPFGRMSAEVNYATVIYSTSTFSDGQVCAGYITFVATTAISGTTVRIGNRIFTAGTDFSIGGPTLATVDDVSSMTAKNFVSSCTFSGITFSQHSNSAIVYATSTWNGASQCQAIDSSNIALISTRPMSRGVDPAFTVNLVSTIAYSAAARSAAAQFYLPSHGFTLGLPVLYRSNGATIGGFTDAATYYAIPIDANNIQLSATSTGAVAGLYKTITSTTTNAAESAPTIGPKKNAGSPTISWDVSNDGSNFVVYPSTAGMAFSVSASSSSDIWDIGALDYRYMRLRAVGPTGGGVNLQVVIHGKTP